MNLLNSQDPSVIQEIIEDPFRKDKWKDIWFLVRNKGVWGKDKIQYEGWVNFRNGSTEGKQSFEADSFPELLTKIQSFMITLK